METLEHCDVPSATITIAPGSDATEGGASGSFIVTRDGDTFWPTVDQSAGTRDYWEVDKEFTIKGAATSVRPWGTPPAPNRYPVLRSFFKTIDEPMGNNGVMPALPQGWKWRAGDTYGKAVWSIERTS